MYWSLTAACVHFVRDFVDANPGYLEIHKRVYAPDEVFFHSLVKQSPFGTAITQDFSGGNHPDHLHHANHFIDWAGIGAGSRESLVLDERDLAALMTSTALFARKFDAERSGSLLDLVDENVHAASTVSLTS